MDTELLSQEAQEVAKKGRRLAWANRRSVIFAICVVIFLLLLEDVWGLSLIHISEPTRPLF
ncbi:hypothetical protein [uncultured Olegusella sp.]|uniref:hypothetical protein n=1 Tax=uncultured Olegusella sp. TaxID=1979846 RepID=UPI00261EE00E|nr:hypothetical protein [uncultured Olegusella sp.]